MDSLHEKTVAETTPPVCPSEGSEHHAPPQAPASVSFYKKYQTYLVATLLSVLIVAGAIWYVYYAPVVVAVVDGNRIYEDELAESIALVEQAAAQQGIDPSDEQVQLEIRSQALEILINNTMLLGAAEEAGITVTPEDAQTKYDELVAELGSEEELLARMKEMGLTEKKLRSNIEERILADKYIESVTDIETLSVTDAEVDEFVKALSTGGTELPPLEEIRPQIEAQILNQKQQQVVAELITKLRTEAEIEIVE